MNTITWISFASKLIFGLRYLALLARHSMALYVAKFINKETLHFYDTSTEVLHDSNLQPPVIFYVFYKIDDILDNYYKRNL